MTDLLRVRVSGPLEPYASGFASELARQGYVPGSVLGHVRVLAHLSRWLAGEGLDGSDLSAETLERFVAARRSAGYREPRTSRGLAPLAGYLRGLGVAPLPAPFLPATPVEELLERYRRYLLVERGLAMDTVVRLVGAAGRFVSWRARHGTLDLGGLRSADVSGYVLAESRRRSGTPGRLLVGELRSLLGFLALEGEVEPSLVEAVPSVACWRLSGLPKALAPGQREQLFDSCDRRTVVGGRDFAILLLLGRLGLRSFEVAELQLSDLDWRAGEIVIRGKGGRRDRLPLPNDVGEAVANYLRCGRPSTALGRSVFVRALAPHGPLSSKTVSMVVRAAGHRAGLGDLGAHRLRHTVATEMLRAGAPLVEIGQVLRHRSPDTTAIYAKVDREALRSLARPWPGGAS
jgi:integrase/recombinase XerD